MQENRQEPIGDGGNGRVSLGFGDLYGSPGDHIGHFYETKEECKEVLVSFLKAGLEEDEKCV